MDTGSAQLPAAPLPAACLAPWDGHERRHDRISAERVDVALVFRKLVGIDDALDYLVEKAIAAAVSQRVLRESVYRRSARLP